MDLEIKARIEYDEHQIRRAILELKESGRELNYDNISAIFLKHSKARIVPPDPVEDFPKTQISLPKAWTATNPPPQK